VVNALAVPGGYVVVFRGLLERTVTPEEMAGVMAHELQHVLHRHATRAVIQDASTGLLLMALTGDVTGPLAYGLQTARTLGDLRYSRRAEEEADTDGMKMMLAARLDPAGMITFFERIRKEEGAAPRALTYLSTHPLAADRLQRLKAMAAAWTGTPEPLLPGDRWADVAKRC
jgi:predicted Zn-dependent protease